MKQNNLKAINDIGQSIWLDFFDREIMNSGKLKKIIAEDGITGVTSNPAIFEKAISSGPDYDEDITTLSQTIGNNEVIFFDVAVKDIRRAADLFKNVYEQSGGEDGFVSLEVSPHLAYDTQGTIKQAQALWKAVSRKNVMIKIPATTEGLPAIRKCISEGINVNITLLFGLPRYRQVADAYLSGLEDRVKANKPIDEVSSVASFFVSRIDAMIDPKLENGLAGLKGEIAIASAKKAYHMYKDIFGSERFKKLVEKNAKRQRLLWASTGTKDASFSDVKYVEALIGPETINTIPVETLENYRDHGQPESRLEHGVDKADKVLAKLEKAGIDLHVITKKLEDEGIQKFNKAYDRLLNAIEKKKLMDFYE